MQRSILVTGAHGFLGRHVARRLARAGHAVIGLGHGGWTRQEQRDFGLSFWHTADVTLDTLTTYAGQPDAILHCAGSGSVGFSVQQPYQDFVRTVSSTAAVLEYVRLHSPMSAVVYPSSAAVYGNADRLPIHETDVLRPASPYGVHKLMAEDLCRSYATHFGIAVAVIRFFSIYGEGLQKQLLWDACSKAARGEPEFFGSGAESRDWLHVEDAAALLETAVSNAAPSCPIVNGGSGENASVSAVLDELFDASTVNSSPTFTGVAKPGDPLGFCADIARARAWGWQPTIPWRDGVRRYAAWYAGYHR